mgnify:FL=1|tara:strand:+ start:1144 stop:2181 length:1038 start_codon:yes stop_codon:yes gene_type:complete
MKIKVGFIGTGFIAQQCHLPSFQLIKDCKIEALSDLQKDLADRLASRNGIKKVYRDHKELIADETIDAVVITLPRKLTAGVVKESLLAGKHVFTEKPLALNLKTAEELVHISKINKLILYVGYMKQFDHGFISFKQELSRLTSLGKDPLFLKANCFMGDSYCNPIGDFKSEQNVVLPKTEIENLPNWLTKERQVGYENFLNVFSHLIHAIHDIQSDTLLPIATTINNEGVGISLFRSGNTPVEISTSKSQLSEWHEDITVVYEDHIVKVTFPPALLKNVPAKVQIISGNSNHQTISSRPNWSWSFLNQAEAFIEMCNQNSTQQGNAQAAKNNIKVVEELFKLPSC